MMECNKTIEEKKLCSHIKANGNVHIFVSKINKNERRIVSCLDCDTELGFIYSIPLGYNLMLYKEGLQLGSLIFKRLKEMGFKLENNQLLESESIAMDIQEQENKTKEEAKMECNHIDNTNKDDLCKFKILSDLSKFNNEFYCESCNKLLGRYFKDKSVLLIDQSEKNLYKYFELYFNFEFRNIIVKYVQDLPNFKFEYEKIEDNKNQIDIINNQALKISELESEVKRLEKIVIGLSERLINERKEA